MKGGSDTVALHSIFAGVSVPAEEMRRVLGLTMEQFRSLLTVAGSFGLVEASEENVLFVSFQKDSAQGARLEWCLEDRKDEARRNVLAMKGKLMLRFLGSPPKGQS
jgi:hypothetical protein